MAKAAHTEPNFTASTHVTLASYVIGFVMSLGLTMTAFALVEAHIISGHNLFSHPFLHGAVAALALLQFAVQLVFFLHLGRETKPRWKILVLSFMVLIVTILVGGSLWIMKNLNYRMLPTPQQVNQYMNEQGGGM